MNKNVRAALANLISARKSLDIEATEAREEAERLECAIEGIDTAIGELDLGEGGS